MNTFFLFDRFLLKEERPVKKQKTSHGESSDDSQDYRYSNLYSFIQELVSRKLKKIRNSNGGFNVVTLFWKEKLMLRFLHVNYYSI